MIQLPENQLKTARFAFFGDSHMRHAEGKGYVEMLVRSLTRVLVTTEISVMNRAVGGFTSRDVVRAMLAEPGPPPYYDLLVVGCGTNDVWRGLQGRPEEAVPEDEYRENMRRILEKGVALSRTVVALSAPFADPGAYAPMNRALRVLNELLETTASHLGVWFLDVFGELCSVHERERSPALWSDGVHLSDRGNAVVSSYLLQALRERFPPSCPHDDGS